MVNSKEYIKDSFMVNTFPSIVDIRYIDVLMTEKINNHISLKSSDFLEIEEGTNQNFFAFEKLRLLFDDLLLCDEIESYYWQASLRDDNSNVPNVLNNFKIKGTNCIAFSLCEKWSNEHRKYLIFVFSNTILVFIKSDDRPTAFLCALDTNAFSMSYKTKIEERKAIVYENSRESIEYYEKYNPVPDSKILSMCWEVTNHDGSRSFRGGLKPENNPLHFELEYGLITLGICAVQLEYAFSKSDLSKQFFDAYAEYIKDKQTLICDNNEKQFEIFDKALAIVKKICSPPKIKSIKKVILLSVLLIHLVGMFSIFFLPPNSLVMISSISSVSFFIIIFYVLYKKKK